MDHLHKTLVMNISKPRILATVPDWNNFTPGTKSKDWYQTLFSFFDTYLKDDGGLLVFMLHGLTYDLQRHASKQGWVVKAEWMCYQTEPLVHVLFSWIMVNSIISSCRMISMNCFFLKALYLKLIVSFIWLLQMYNFCLVLLVNSGADFTRRPLQFQLNSDLESHSTANDPLKFLTLWNLLSVPTAKDADSTWRGNREISDVLLQIVIEMCTKASQIVLDISRASHRACTASRRHFISFKADKDIFDVLLKPLCELGDSIDDDKDDDSNKDPQPSLRK